MAAMMAGTMRAPLTGMLFARVLDLAADPLLDGTA
jgi:hypothetical protein